MTNTAKILNFGRGNFAGQERNVADLDDGYARLSNMLLEAYSGADLTKRQFKVLLAILRKTYGWNKPMDRITDSQLSEITKLPVKRCNEAKLELVRMNIIKQQGGMFGPNKNISEWCIPQNEGKSPKTRDKTSLKLGDCYPSKQGDTKDTITKEKRKDYSSENSGESSDQPENDLSVVKPDAAIQSGSKWGTAEDGMTSLREYAGYHGGGSGFGGQLRAWNPPSESVDAALLPNFTRGNARADDLVRNNGYAANAIQLHQDHIVGSFFRLSHRPSWRYLGIGEEEARAFSREVEAAWKEFAEDDCCCIDVERKRTFTMMIREGVAMHAFNGELFVQATWDTSPSRLFRTQFRMVSPKRISNPNNTGDSRNCRAGVQINDSGAALGYYVSEDGYPGWMPQKWTWIPRELPGGRASFIHVFEPVEDGQTRGANVFYSVMEQMKMLDTLQNTQLQSAIVKAMYAATIESELDTQSAMDFILGANSQEQRERLTGWIGEIAAYYAAAPVRLGGAKVPHLMPGDSLNLQTAQDTDNGYSVFEQSLLRYIAAGLGVSYEQLSRNYAQMSYSTARASANESWAYFMGRRKFVASRQASQMFLCWLEEAIVRRVVTLPSKARFSFQEARSAWGNCDWIGSGRMAIDGLKEVQEAVMLIEAGLSTYEKECAKRGDDYQEIFAQQVRETMERRAAGLKPPAWAAAAFESGLRQSTEEEKSDSRAA
ncbi:phage portal protein [Escherichia coli]|nr:phage portal protein [Escherichia coli]